MTPTRPGAGRGGEQGLVVVTVALSMTILLLFVAFAVDLGAVYNERRQDQSAADAGALTGGRLLLDVATVPPDETAIVNDIILITHQNLDTEVALSDWAARWPACSDPDHLAMRSATSECISFNRFYTRVRVKIPLMEVETAFSKPAGFDSFQVSALAEAELVLPGSTSGVLPFGMPGGGSSASEVCLKSGQQSDHPTGPPCDGPVTGNFGSLDFALYGSPLLGTPQMCTGEEPKRLAMNIALGVDHNLSTWDGGAGPIVNDRAECPDTGAEPNQVAGETGTKNSLEPGLVSGLTLGGRTAPGRLTQTPFQKRQVRNDPVSLDDRPLWTFIDASLDTASTPPIPASCVRSAITSKAQMKTCLDDYKLQPAGTYAELFTDDSGLADGIPDIQQSPRFAFVPELWETSFTSGSSNDYEIRAFRPIFVQTLYFKCNPGGCRIIFDPGETGTGIVGSSNEKAEALTAFNIPAAALPVSARAPDFPSRSERTVILRK